MQWQTQADAREKDKCRAAGRGEGLGARHHPIGPDIEIIDMEEADATACMVLCQDYGGCKAFTYVKPRAASNPHALCKIKSAVGPATLDRCCVSGLP